MIMSMVKYGMSSHLTVNTCTLVYIITDSLCFFFSHSKEHLIGHKSVRCKMMSSGRERPCMTEVHRWVQSYIHQICFILLVIDLFYISHLKLFMHKSVYVLNAVNMLIFHVSAFIQMSWDSAQDRPEEQLSWNNNIWMTEVNAGGLYFPRCFHLAW